MIPTISTPTPANTKPVLAGADPRIARAATTSAHPDNSKKKPVTFKGEPPREFSGILRFKKEHHNIKLLFPQ
jgi:hypothetical protein